MDILERREYNVDITYDIIEPTPYTVTPLCHHNFCNCFFFLLKKKKNFAIVLAKAHVIPTSHAIIYVYLVEEGLDRFLSRPDLKKKKI